MDMMQSFCTRRPLATQGGCSPSALRRVMQTLAATILETAATWEQDGVARGAGHEIIGAVDVTADARNMCRDQLHTDAIVVTHWYMQILRLRV